MFLFSTNFFYGSASSITTITQSFTSYSCIILDHPHDLSPLMVQLSQRRSKRGIPGMDSKYVPTTYA